MRLRRTVILVGCLVTALSPAAAQEDSTSHPAKDGKEEAGGGTRVRVWIAPVGIVTSAALDPEAREWALRGHSQSLDRFAKSVNRLGTAQRLVPAMAITYVGAALMHHESLATATLNTAAGYAASDLVESVLKPMIGRERPHVEGNSHRFHPLTGNGDWHSFPSAHVAHIAAIAAAVSEQTQSAPLSALSDILIGLVSWDRVYEDQHWASDVTATIVLSSLVSSATVRWLRTRQSQSSNAAKDASRAATRATSATVMSPAPR
jgi:membrane-associated phospholipid phosphatase